MGDAPDPVQPRAERKESDHLVEGSGIVFLAGLVDKTMRLGTTWFLARQLGASALGAYTMATTIVTLAQMVAPLGADSGAVLFAARHQESGLQAKLKGTIETVLVLGVLGGMITALVVLGAWSVGWLQPELGIQLPLAVPAIVLGAPMAVLAGIAQASRRFRVYAVAILVVLPAVIFVGSTAGVLLGGGVPAALAAFVVAHAFALGALARSFWKEHGALLADASRPAERNVREMLGYSIPQSLSKMLWQFNLWTDILMIDWLSTKEDVGVYRVALSIAMLGTLPVMALTTAMNPRAAALVYRGETARLDELLKVGTRTLLLLLVPCFMALALLPSFLLELFDPEYVRGANVLLVLVLGQSVYVLTGPTNSLLAMGGYARVNLVNNLVAVGLNATLTFLLIPRFGLLGAAVGTVIAQVLWSRARALEVRWVLRWFALDRR
jgi:O-antigen/teichoic acid export membrane protein